MEKKNNKLFWQGILIGFFGGVVGNILTSSAFTLINGNCQNGVCWFGTTVLLVLSLVVFIIFVNFLLKRIK